MTNTRVEEIIRAMETGETSLFIQPFELRKALEELVALRGEVAALEMQVMRGYGQAVFADPIALMRGLG